MPKPSQVNVDSTKAWLLYQNFGPEVENVLFDNHGPNDVTIGGSTVVAGAGITLKMANPPQTIPMNGDSLYGICAATQTAVVQVLSVVGGR